MVGSSCKKQSLLSTDVGDDKTETITGIPVRKKRRNKPCFQRLRHITAYFPFVPGEQPLPELPWTLWRLPKHKTSNGGKTAPNLKRWQLYFEIGLKYMQSNVKNTELGISAFQRKDHICCMRKKYRKFLLTVFSEFQLWSWQVSFWRLAPEHPCCFSHPSK